MVERREERCWDLVVVGGSVFEGAGSWKWRKGSRSGRTGCVEFVQVIDGVLVRDSKDPTGPVLSFEKPEWERFVGEIKCGRFGVTPSGEWP